MGERRNCRIPTRRPRAFAIVAHSNLPFVVQGKRRRDFDGSTSARISLAADHRNGDPVTRPARGVEHAGIAFVPGRSTQPQGQLQAMAGLQGKGAGGSPVSGALIAAGLLLYAIAAPRLRQRPAASGVTARRGRPADQPSDVPDIGWWGILKRVWNNIGEHNVSIMAAGVGFYALLSIFPGLTALISLYGLIANPSDVERLLASQGLLPPEAVDLLVKQTSALVEKGMGKLSLGLIISLTVALWSTNYAISTLMTALNAAYGEREKRNYVVAIATSLALTSGLVLFAVLALLLVAVLPAVIGILPVPPAWRTTIALVRWPLLVVIVMAALAAMYRFAPSRTEARWRWVSGGAVIATVAWIVVSLGFSIYVERFSTYDRTYGSLGAVVVLLMWFYLSAFVVLLGAELDAEMERRSAASRHAP
jgi:membrane protein